MAADLALLLSTRRRPPTWRAVLSSTAAISVHDVLDLGSGGGHVALHLRDRFTLTLADISEDMLASSRRLHPRCRHVRGDMRTMRLEQDFDAVLAHDAIDYVTTQDDLAMVIATAFAHCRPGGIAVFVPDYVKDDFRALTGGGGGGDDGTGRRATFREQTWDPDPDDDWVQAEYEFILRAADGTAQVIKETHRLGAFSRRMAAPAGRGGLHGRTRPHRTIAARQGAREPVHRPPPCRPGGPTRPLAPAATLATAVSRRRPDRVYEWSIHHRNPQWPVHPYLRLTAGSGG